MNLGESTAHEPGSNPSLPPPSEPARVLVIDDEETVSHVLCEMLKAGGFEAVAVRSAQEGLDLLRRSPFQVVITDLFMPGMDGLRAMAALKNVDPDL